MKRLCTADFEMDSLGIGDWEKLKAEATSCAVGEAWDWTDIYTKNSMGEMSSTDPMCDKCRQFSYRIPDSVGDSFVDFDCKCGADGGEYDTGCTCEREDPIKVLTQFARHIEEAHPELMNKKEIPNDC